MTGDRLVKLLTRIGLAALVAILGVVGYGGWRLHKGMQWVREQNARADELPTLEDLLGPPIPDDENAAVVYQEAFDAFELTDEDTGVLLGEPHRQNLGRRLYDMSKLEAVVARKRRALALLEEAASMRKCQFSIDWSDAAEASFPHFDQMRRAARLMTAKVHLLAARGEIQQALDAAARCLDVGEDARQGAPNIIAFLVEVYIHSSALRAVEQAIHAQDCPRPVSERLRARLRQTDLVRAYLATLEGERAYGLLIIEQMLDKAPRETKRESGGSPEHAADRGSVARWMFQGSRAWYAKFMADYIELAPLSYRQSHEKWPQLEKRIERIPLPYRLLSGILLPVLGRSVARRDQMVAHINLCIVALDLKAYKHEHGAYPETLEELPEASEESYAGDVFSGKPFKYRREGEGFLLYSFGEDLDDDGGEPLGRGANGKLTPDEGDVVWRCTK